ncbi:MAG TPA: TetR/AcrR family transcriptional regulator [Nitrospirota bacterium]|nr:TetR/AcrR family transcriptional regulator [Nitrospirota bacterium]
MIRKNKLQLKAPFAQNTAGRIVSEATRQFAEKGYDGVSIKAISVAAGVNIAAINYHFDSKANLFRQIIEQFIAELLVSARKTLQPPQGTEDLKIRLEIFVGQTIEAFIKQPEIISIIQRELERTNNIYEKTIFKHLEALIEFLTQAKKKGLLAADVDPFFAASFLIGQIVYAGRKERAWKSLFGCSSSDKKFRNQWIQQLLRLFLGGVLKK